MVKNSELNKESGKEKRKKNLIPYQYKKGQSGNIKGHPKGQQNDATIYRNALIKLGKLNGKTPEEIEAERIADEEWIKKQEKNV